MSKNAQNLLITREVCDPADRKKKTWQLGFAKGSTGKIIRKHIGNPEESWGSVLEHQLIRSLSSNKSGAIEQITDRQTLQQILLDHASAACKRPQAMVFDEIRDLHSPESVRCCLLICHCGLLIAVRNIDTEPKIHSAFFRRGVAHALAPQRWKRLVRSMRADHVVAERQSGKLSYPAPDVVKEVEDDEHPERKYWRKKIDFLSKHTWGFIEQSSVWRPLGEIPAWETQP